MISEGITHPNLRRSLFWRLWWRSLTIKRPQAVLAIGSVLVGATVASMLLNLYGDARRKMTQEFSAYGPNIVLAPADAPAAAEQTLAGNETEPLSNSETVNRVMDDSVMNHLAPLVERGNGFAAVPILNMVTRLKKASAQPDNAPSRSDEPVIVVAVGADFPALRRFYPSWRIQTSAIPPDGPSCVIGTHIATRLRLGRGDALELETIASNTNRPKLAEEGTPTRTSYRVSSILSTGASEDDQLFVPLASLQRLGALSGKISLVELSVPGETAEVERAISDLAQALHDLPRVEIRPIRQIVYSAGKVLGTIRWVMFSLTAVILIIIALCVTATMTAIVLERRKDIAVMKSLGASDHILVQLFLSEGAALGMIGGVAGYGLGLGLAHEIARQLFGVNLSFSWWTLPLVCSASVALAVLATFFPVEIVHGIRPARVLRGE